MTRYTIILCSCVIAASGNVFASTESRPVCRDENGAVVDWFVTFKLPRLEHTWSQSPLIRDGLAHATFTSSSSNSFVLSAKSIEDSTSAPGRTLAPLYTSDDNVLRLLYNDQSPDAPVSFTHGHTKGVVLASAQGGIWLVHSVPHYPPPQNATKYGYPSTGHHYGQSMLCITLSSDQFNILGEQLSYNFPKVYDWGSPNSLITEWPHLAAVARGQHVRQPPYYRQNTLRSAGGQTFQIFAKTAQFGKDLYSDWVATALQANLLVESWPNGPGRLPSACQFTYRVENVLGVTLAGVEWRDEQDHSKWAVQKNNLTSSHWLCIGDINRMESQEERGGGTVCMDSASPWNAMRTTVTHSELCDSHDTYQEIETNHV